MVTTLHDVMQLRDRAHAMFVESRKLFEIASRGFLRNSARYKHAKVTVRRAFSTDATSYDTTPQHRSPRAARLLRVLISSRIDEGRLPDCVPAMTPGAPGFGGECAACDGYMPPTRLVMAVASGDTFVYLHADCYIIWRAQCQLRAVLRRFQ